MVINGFNNAQMNHLEELEIRYFEGNHRNLMFFAAASCQSVMPRAVKCFFKIARDDEG